MKKLLATISVFVLLVILSSCFFLQPRDNYFGFSKKSFTVIEELDTHGSFLGDGSYYLILDCSDNPEAALKIVADWKQLPLSWNLKRIMYGSHNLSEEAHMPKIENGYYYFEDRHSKATDPSDDSDLFGRGSYNFSLAVYDADTHRLYYFEFDT